MTLRELCRTVESHEMAARVNVASDLRVALDIVRTHPAVRSLTSALRGQSAVEQVLRRLFELTEQATDLRYENSNDTALMIYAWLLYQHDVRLASVASVAISRVPSLWWARRFATQLFEHPLQRNDTAETVSTGVVANADAGDRLFAATIEFSPLTLAHFSGGSGIRTLRNYVDVQTQVVPPEQPPLFVSGVSPFTAWARSDDTQELETVAA